MSEFHVTVVKIGKIGKHPNADTLSITQVCGRYPVIFKNETYKTGDFAVHFPPDSLVNTKLDAFSWLSDKAQASGYFRVKFTKIRGIPSYGFLAPVTDFSGRLPDTVYEGQDLQSLLGEEVVKKYDPGPCYQQGTEVSGDIVGGPFEHLVPLYDIEGLRRYEGLFGTKEAVSVTEKIHGSNGRWVFIDGELRCGSRTKFRKNSVWNVVAEKHGLSAVLEQYPGLVLFGEVYGDGIQDLTYGLKDKDVVFFDCYDTVKGRYLDVDLFNTFCLTHNLPRCPELYRGPFNLEKMYALAEGQTVLGGGCHVREGIVIKPLYERWDSDFGGRVFLKLPGEGYLLRKSG